jgi:PKD-like domain
LNIISSTLKLKIMRNLKTFITLLLFGFISSSLTAQVPVIDGNPSEWPGILNNPANAKKAYAHDPFNQNGVDNQWTGGSSDADVNPSTDWHWVYGVTNDKGDIGNAGAVLIGCTLYFFGDRSAENGDAQIGFWFFIDDVQPIGTGVASSGFSGHHTAGDLLIISNFVGGGGNAVPTVYVWTIDAAHPLGYPRLISSSTNATLTTNATTYPAPNQLMYNGQTWSFSPKFGTAQTYPVPLFFEGSVNVCMAEGTTTPPCFQRFLLETRNSQSISASLQDFVAGSFSGKTTVIAAVTLTTGIEKTTEVTADCPEIFRMNLLETLTAGLTATSPDAGTTYSWTKSPIDNATSFTFDPITGAATFTVKSLVNLATTYQFIVTGTSGGCIGTDTVCIRPGTTCVICGITGPTDICLGSPATYTLDALNPDFDYTWTKPDGSTVKNVQSITVTPATSGPYKVTVTIVSKNGFITCPPCSFSTNVIPIPTVTTQYNAPNCSEKTFTVTVISPTVGLTYTITQSGNSVVYPPVVPTTTANFTFAGLVQGDGYTVTVNNRGCTNTDDCAGQAAPSTAVAGARVARSSEPYNIVLGSPSKVSAVPNPYTDKIRFNLVSAVSGIGKLELFTLLGQKVVTVFEGYIQAGTELIKEYNAPGGQRNTLIYVFKVGDQRVSGKLIGLK